jgi:hypothetical protein
VYINSVSLTRTRAYTPTRATVGSSDGAMNTPDVRIALEKKLFPGKWNSGLSLASPLNKGKRGAILTEISLILASRTVQCTY